MDPITLILGGASIAGSILGTSQRRYIDPKWLEANFGPGAVSEQAQQLFHQILNSPYGESLMSSAAEQGQAFAHNVQREAAAAGFGGGGGASSGSSIFATGAAQGAGNVFQREMAGNFYQAALPMAQQMVQNQLGAYLQGNLPSWGNPQGGMPTAGSNVWSNIGSAAGTAGALWNQAKGTAAKPSGDGTGGTVISGPDNTGQPGTGTVNASAGFSRLGSTTQLPTLQAMLPSSFSRLDRYGVPGAIQSPMRGGLFTANA